MNAFDFRRKRNSFITPMRATYSDSNVAGRMVCVRPRREFRICLVTSVDHPKIRCSRKTQHRRNGDFPVRGSSIAIELQEVVGI